MTPHLVRRIDVAPQRWRNGGGFTRELLARPEGPHWQVRVSVADVEADGPFSAWPGVTRWFAVVKGAGVELDVVGQRRQLRRGDAPFAFDGASATHCRLLDGPTQDLNLMLRGVAGAMALVVDGEPCPLPAGAAWGLYALAAGCCAGIDVPPHALLWSDEAPAAPVFVAAQRPAAAVGYWLWAGGGGPR